MDIKEHIEIKMRDIAGSVIAIIYTFEKETAKGFEHYAYWKSEVISAWLNAVEELGCIPYIIDVKTFMLKVAMGTLPHIDYCVNLNAGNVNLDNLCLVPSLASFVGIQCIPCNAITCAVGEDKYFANQIAKNGKIKLPKEHIANIEGGIIRDRSLGSSVGIRKTNSETSCSETELCQEFIIGTDVTIPVLYNFVNERLEVLPPIAYKHKNGNEWFLSENAKLCHSYEKVSCKLSSDAETEILKLAKSFDIKTYCRFDTRVENYVFDNKHEINLKDMNFIEINPTPTVHNKINFAMALVLASNEIHHKQCFNAYKKLNSNSSITGYILLCSILSLKAKRFQLPD